MKKVLFVLALGAFAACGSGETKTETVVDSPKVETAVPVTPDTTHAGDTTNAGDTTHH